MKEIEEIISAFFDGMLFQLILTLPPLITLSYLLILPTPLAPQARKRATISVLSMMLLTFGSCLLLISLNTNSSLLNVVRIVSASLALVITGLVCAPLLDRTRPVPLLITASLVGIFLTPLLMHGLEAKLPVIDGEPLLYTAIITSCLIALGGSKQFPPHPARGEYTINYRRMFMGWLTFAVLFGLYATAMKSAIPPLVSAIAAAGLCLVRTRTQEAWRKVGEGIMAGTLIALLSPYSPEATAAIGVLAGYMVLRGEALTKTLKLDDPHHLTGTLLLPAMVGLMLPCVGKHEMLTGSLLWLGAAILLGLLGTVAVWPLAKRILRLSLSPKS